jgi:hypothetical protein
MILPAQPPHVRAVVSPGIQSNFFRSRIMLLIRSAIFDIQNEVLPQFGTVYKTVYEKR